MKVIIKNMKRKPVNCTECPICDYNDDCLLLPAYHSTWKEQYKNCPLQEKLQPDPYKSVVALLKDFNLHNEWDGDIRELAQHICDMFKDGPYDSVEVMME